MAQLVVQEAPDVNRALVCRQNEVAGNESQAGVDFGAARIRRQGWDEGQRLGAPQGDLGVEPDTEDASVSARVGASGDSADVRKGSNRVPLLGPVLVSAFAEKPEFCLALAAAGQEAEVWGHVDESQAVDVCVVSSVDPSVQLEVSLSGLK